MRVDNPHYAIASENLILNDTVTIEGSMCRRIKVSELGKVELFSVLDKSVVAGNKATLSGADTTFYIEVD